MLEQNTNDHRTQALPPAASLATPFIASSARSLDDTREWLRAGAYEPPLSASEIAQVQREIDSIIGTTRDNRSILKLIWNGDRRYWKEMHTTWDSVGKPIGNTYKRPQVLYRTIVDGASGRFIRDAFPPRWLLMTLIEPEQYHMDWARESKFFCPDRKMYVQVLPAEPPKERYVYYKIIGLHVAGCCQRAAADDVECNGRYAHPRHAIEALRSIQKGVEESGLKNTSFDQPDKLARRMRENMTNNYVEQALNKFVEDRQRAIDETPLTLASTPQEMDAGSVSQLRGLLAERTERDVEKLQKDLEKRRIK